MANTQFQYSALARPDEDIRLLEILPGIDRDPLECKVETFERRQAPEYVAISYEWGPGPAECPIRLDGKPYLIRHNLSQCVEHLRSHGWGKHYWVDAICINQNDTHERGAQVSVMGSIYSNAWFVAAWIGPAVEDENGGSTAAICFLGRTREEWKELYRDDYRDALPGCEAMSLALDRLCRRTYWRRLWVVQEIGLASSVRIMCGQDVLESDLLQEFFEFLEERHERVDELYRSRTEDVPNEEYNNFKDEYNSRESAHLDLRASDARKLLAPEESTSEEDLVINSIHTPYFVTLLDQHHGRTTCHDLRDRVYGLLSLDETMRDFVPDYDCTEWQLYVRLMVYLQTRYPYMPAIYVSQVLQRALIISSYSDRVFRAIKSFESTCTEDELFYHDVVEEIETVTRVGNHLVDTDLLSVDDLDNIKDSLGLDWTGEDHSFSGRDFTISQQEMLRILITRDDIVPSSTFLDLLNVAPSAVVLPLKPIRDQELHNVGLGDEAFEDDGWRILSPLKPKPLNSTQKRLNSLDDRFGSLDLETYVEDDQYKPLNNRFFVTGSRHVGLGRGYVKPGDKICSAYEGYGPVFVIREPSDRRRPYLLIGRCHVSRSFDERERLAALDNGVDLFDIQEGQVSDTYWSPQVLRFQTFRQRRISEAGDFELRMDLWTLASMSALSEQSVVKSNDRWVKELNGKEPSPDRKTGRRDRIACVVDIPTP